MADILIRNVDEGAIERLKARAKQHGRSLQAEARLALERGAGVGGEEVAVILDRWRQRFAGRAFSDSVELIREDRQR